MTWQIQRQPSPNGGNMRCITGGSGRHKPTSVSAVASACRSGAPTSTTQRTTQLTRKFSEVKKMLFTGVRNKPPELGGGIRSYMNRDQMSPGTSTLVKAMPGPLVGLYLSKPNS